MVYVAVLLLPFISALLLVMDRIEQHVLDPGAGSRRHAGRGRHLRLVPDGRRGAGSAGKAAGKDEGAPVERRAA